MSSAILAQNQVTTSFRAIVFDHTGGIRAVAQREYRQLYPQAGRGECDPEQVRQSQLAIAREVLAKAGLQATDAAAVGRGKAGLVNISPQGHNAWQGAGAEASARCEVFVHDLAAVGFIPQVRIARPGDMRARLRDFIMVTPPGPLAALCRLEP